MFYKTMYIYCDTIYVTKVNSELEADTFFPNLDDDNNWYVHEESEEIQENGLIFKFVTYKNNNPKSF